MQSEKRLIDANDLLSALQKRREDLASAWRTYGAMPDIAKALYNENLECALMVNDAPTADAVEVVHGRWEWKPIGEKTWQLFCSACGSGDGTSEDYNYCPNCGAKMDGERKAGCEIAEIVENCEDCGFCDKT